VQQKLQEQLDALEPLDEAECAETIHVDTQEPIDAEAVAARIQEIRDPA
jgi:hypothetical protein